MRHSSLLYKLLAGVSVWVLLATSCSNSKLFAKREQTTTATPKTEEVKSDSITKPKIDYFNPVEQVEVEQDSVEAIVNEPKKRDPWGKNYKFTEKELLYVGSSTTNMFDKSQAVEVDLDELSREATYPFLGIFSSDFGYRSGRMHSGVDISARNGATDIRAFMDGVVRISKYISYYGNTIVIRHQNGMETVYSHAAKNLVKVGDLVNSGDKIAIVGSTGRATGKHLHFEIRVDGVAIDPNFILDVKNNKVKDGVTYLHKFSDSKILASQQEDRSKVIVKVYHTIRSGDTLGAIARKYRVPMKQICSLNNITTTTILRIGRSLRIS